MEAKKEYLIPTTSPFIVKIENLTDIAIFDVKLLNYDYKKTENELKYTYLVADISYLFFLNWIKFNDMDIIKSIEMRTISLISNLVDIKQEKLCFANEYWDENGFLRRKKYNFIDDNLMRNGKNFVYNNEGEFKFDKDSNFIFEYLHPKTSIELYLFC